MFTNVYRLTQFVVKDNQAMFISWKLINKPVKTDGLKSWIDNRQTHRSGSKCISVMLSKEN